MSGHEREGEIVVSVGVVDEFFGGDFQVVNGLRGVVQGEVSASSLVTGFVLIGVLLNQRIEPRQGLLRLIARAAR